MLKTFLAQSMSYASTKMRNASAVLWNYFLWCCRGKWSFWPDIIQIYETVSPLYNSICYNKIIGYNVNWTRTKWASNGEKNLMNFSKNTPCEFSISPRQFQEIPTKYILWRKIEIMLKNILLHIRTLQQQTRFYSKIFGEQRLLL